MLPRITLAAAVLRLAPMVAIDVIRGHVEHGHEVFDVVKGQGAAGDDQIDLAHAVGDGGAVEDGFDLVAYGKNTHKSLVQEFKSSRVQEFKNWRGDAGNS